MHAAETRTHRVMDLERRLELPQDVLEATGLEAALRVLGVAVHGIADPQHLVPGGAHRFDRSGQCRLDVPRAEAVDERELARDVLGIQRGHEALQPIDVHRCADLDADRIGDAATVLDMRPADLGGPHADPRHVRGEVVPAILTRDETGLGLFVMEDQSFVAGIEIGAQRLVDLLRADGLEELEPIGDRGDDPLVLDPKRRMTDETEVPVLRVMQIREAAVDQRPDEVQRERRALIAAQQQGGIGFPGLRRELRSVDDIASVGGQRHPVTGLGVGRARLRVLTGHAAYADDGTLETVDEHQTHLKQYLETLGDAA